ncbi:MFS transporter [uncultured Paludibaculum sp.]|uniref:MFS transporter n=1 Tax=uncultured Paludibaculum sp. TaxID=1765020 RepID=UPI002AABF597|nr:MFS transporter [uncultured Paludibaculum sp.]
MFFSRSGFSPSAPTARFASAPGYRWYVVWMLWCISLFNYADRQAIFSVFPLLEREMHLSAIQLGLLGSAFAWVYGVAAPVAGMLVDRMRRTTAVIWGLQIWSTICLATGFSRDFTHLVAFRAAEGLGESIYYPASMSLVSDYHDKRTRSRAMGLHQTSVYLGTVAGGYFAGLIGERHGWRSSFFVFGALGIVLGLVLRKWLAEPRRGQADEFVAATEAPPGVSYAGFLRHLLSTPTALLLMLGFVCMNFVAVLLLAWLPKFLFDKFHLGLAAAALLATTSVQAASVLGSLGGGWLADRMRARVASGRIWVQALAALAAAPFVVLCGQAGSLAVCLVALCLWGVFKGFYDANTWASLFDVVRPEERGRAAGLMNTAGWFGGGSAPVLVGFAIERMGMSAAISSASAVYAVGGAILILCAWRFAPFDIARLNRAAR